MLKLGLEFAPTLPQTDDGGGNEDDPASCGIAVSHNFFEFFNLHATIHILLIRKSIFSWRYQADELE